jgi:hypothetical protein
MSCPGVDATDVSKWYATTGDFTITTDWDVKKWQMSVTTSHAMETTSAKEQNLNARQVSACSTAMAPELVKMSQ